MAANLRLVDDEFRPDRDRHSVSVERLTRDQLEQRLTRYVELPLADAQCELMTATTAWDQPAMAAALKRISSIGHLARGIALAIEESHHDG